MFLFFFVLFCGFWPFVGPLNDGGLRFLTYIFLVFFLLQLDDGWTREYDLYDWRKLNVDDAADKKLVEEYFIMKGDFGGKKLYDGEVFK